MQRQQLKRTLAVLAGAALATLATPLMVCHAADDTRPYDEKLLHLSEILGSVHYLRELCGAEEGQLWRTEMEALAESEGTTPLRRARLVASFNKGYRSYRRTYQTCTTSAETAIGRFLTEGADLAAAIAAPKKPAP